MDKLVQQRFLNRARSINPASLQISGFQILKPTATYDASEDLTYQGRVQRAAARSYSAHRYRELQEERKRRAVTSRLASSRQAGVTRSRRILPVRAWEGQLVLDPSVRGSASSVGPVSAYNTPDPINLVAVANTANYRSWPARSVFHTYSSGNPTQSATNAKRRRLLQSSAANYTSPSLYQMTIDPVSDTYEPQHASSSVWISQMLSISPAPCTFSRPSSRPCSRPQSRVSLYSRTPSARAPNSRPPSALSRPNTPVGNYAE